MVLRIACDHNVFPTYVKLFINVPFISIMIFLVNHSADKNRCSTQSTPAFALVHETVHFLVKPNGFISVAGDWFFVSPFPSFQPTYSIIWNEC